jgi:catechol 2,3-dioxygenase-like lactoylglutathione lyase family enzyme
MSLTIERIDHVVLNCRDVEATASWYERVLRMKREYFREGRIALKFGSQKLNLRPAHADPAAWVSGVNTEPGAADLCFITSMSPDNVVAHFKSEGVDIVDGPAARTGALGAMTSVYCRDPDGNLIEVASYPVG